MAHLTLLIGDRATCEGSLQAWLLLRHAGLMFDVDHLWRERAVDSGLGFAGQPPILLVDDVPIWGALAIGEFLAEHVPSLWPGDPRARALARAVAGEAQGGFRWIKALLPLDVTRRFANTRLPRLVRHDLERISALWQGCRAYFGAGGSLLFGDFSLADALQVGIAMRLIGNGVRLEGEADRYLGRITTLPAVVEWVELARREQPGVDQAVDRGGAEGLSSLRPPPVESEVTPFEREIRGQASEPAGSEAPVKPIGAGIRRRH